MTRSVSMKDIETVSLEQVVRSFMEQMGLCFNKIDPRTMLSINYEFGNVKEIVIDHPDEAEPVVIEILGMKN